MPTVAMYHVRLEGRGKPARHGYAITGDPNAVAELAKIMLQENPQAAVEEAELGARGDYYMLIVMGTEQ